MMEKRAFHPLKASGKGPESSKQAEMALARIVKILAISRLAGEPNRGREIADLRERVEDTRSG
jgi:hypothetical protein